MAGFLSLDELFKGRHFDQDIVILCVRWSLRFELSFRCTQRMIVEWTIDRPRSAIISTRSPLRPRVRTALEPVRSPGRRFMAG